MVGNHYLWASTTYGVFSSAICGGAGRSFRFRPMIQGHFGSSPATRAGRMSTVTTSTAAPTTRIESSGSSGDSHPQYALQRRSIADPLPAFWDSVAPRVMSRQVVIRSGHELLPAVYVVGGASERGVAHDVDG